jgi:predicted  nucleic acid-binding Zn-ribbon protein
MELHELRKSFLFSEGKYIMIDDNVVHNIRDILRFAIEINSKNIDLKNKLDEEKKEVEKLKRNVQKINNKLHEIEQDFDYLKRGVR